MLYKDIESYFTSEEKTNELLEQYETIFLDIDEIDEKSRNNEIETAEEIDKVISRLNGYANIMDFIGDIAGTYKTGLQSICEQKRINEAVKGNTKPNMTQITSQASADVQFLRRVRNLFQAYAKRAGRALSTYKAKLAYRKNYSYTKDDSNE
jgi:hypothetical protein